jgi:hypothetical protein
MGGLREEMLELGEYTTEGVTGDWLVVRNRNWKIENENGFTGMR